MVQPAMKLYFSDTQLQHDPRQFMVAGRIVAPVEVPERARIMAGRLAKLGLDVTAPADHGLAPITAVHADHYITFLATAWQRFQALPNAGPEVWPNVHPHVSAGPDFAPRPPPRAQGIVGLAGWYMGDLAVAIGENSWAAAYASAQAAIAGAEDLSAGGRSAYALCRPPGHHAYADRCAGFCMLNNGAIAAEHLRRQFARVAIVDFDTHHGDGTQAIFYRRSDVLYASTHTDPAHYYPWFVGYADERGAGPGEGANVNLPLPVGAGDDAFIAANVALCDAVTAFRPDVLVVSAGWDAHRDDPLSKLTVTTEAFRRVGALWGGLGLPTLIVQEGGYSLSAIEEIAPAFVTAFLEARPRG